MVYKRYSLNKKWEVVTYKKDNPDKSWKEISEHFDIPESTCRSICKNERKYGLFSTLNLPNTGDRCRAFSQTRVEIEKVLLQTFDQSDIGFNPGNARRGIPMTGKSLHRGAEIREVSREIVETDFFGRSNLKCSRTWYKRNKKNPKATFRHRASLNLRRQSGGRAIFDREAALVRQAEILEIMTNYLPSKIFNFDETPFPWRFKNNKGEIKKGENIKEYLSTDEKKTLTFGSMLSADGQVKFPLIIDRSVPCDAEFRRSVRSYDGFKHAEVVINNQRCQFYVTKENQMNKNVWQHYCLKFMESQQDEILLLCDGHRSHALDPEIHHSIRMEKFFPGSTSLTQPADNQINLWLKRKMRSAVQLFGIRIGPNRGQVASRSWVITKAFETMLAIPADVVTMSWRKVALQHPMLAEQIDGERNEIEVGDIQ